MAVVRHQSRMDKKRCLKSMVRGLQRDWEVRQSRSVVRFLHWDRGWKVFNYSSDANNAVASIFPLFAIHFC